ncbi:phosphatidate cytidylyltransferase, partial [Staphylococcus auricularis]|uniref:phosphatidate cytidylyltransferase n=1 Tax=Staphylococcus auricularis TaxID=29379 RepID=UPI0017856112
ETPAEGLHYILLPFLVLSLTDTRTYIFPPLIPKHKFSPLITPNKTIQPFIPPIFSTLLLPLLIILFLHFNLPISLFLIYTLILTIFPQLRHLVQSAFKPHFPLKHSPPILPPHPPILDPFHT